MAAETEIAEEEVQVEPEQSVEETVEESVEETTEEVVIEEPKESIPEIFIISPCTIEGVTPNLTNFNCLLVKLRKST